MSVEYRLARTPKDVEKIRKYCADNKLAYPSGIVECIFYAIDQEENIIGVCALKRVLQIEPLIAQNGMIGSVLAEKALAIASTLYTEVMGMSNKEAVVELMEHYGFVVTDKDMTILKKEI